MRFIEESAIKINLNLRVFGKRPDGYHEIHTLFWRRRSPEFLSVEPLSESFEEDILSVVGMDIPGENLLCRVMRMIRELWIKERDIPRVRLELFKCLPMGSGVGAGSGNAAALLHWLRRFEMDIPSEESARLGADIAFLASRCPLALAEGVGEKMTFINAALDLPGLVIFPEWCSNTRQAYADLDVSRTGTTSEEDYPQAREESERILARLCSGESIGLLPNDFLPFLRTSHPEYDFVFNRAASAGALAWGLCGSGSAMFILFREFAEIMGFQRCLWGLKWINKVLVLE